MAGFFPIFFKQFWNSDPDLTISTFRLGLSNSLAFALVAVSAPLLGTIADRGGTRKLFLVCFAFTGAAGTGLLSLVSQGNWLMAAALYVVAVIGFAGANIFYDSLIVDVTARERLDVTSALGYSLGYLGGGLLFAVNVAMTINPAFFGLSGAASAIKLSFLTVAAWWGLFSLPLLFMVREKRQLQRIPDSEPPGAFRHVVKTFREIRNYRRIFLFLIGYWLYIDGVDTVVVMAVDYGLGLGFDYSTLIAALLITQFVGFPAAIVFGKVGERFGTKTGIYIGLSVYIAVAVWGCFMSRPAEFYGLAVGVGLVQGGVQSLSRAFFAKLIPADRAAEFFGFYNMIGKFAAIVGPLLMGLVSLWSGSQRLSILAVVGLFLAGGIVLFFVKAQETSDRSCKSNTVGIQS
jgi:UMF1 family MFS transporter